MCEYKSIHYRKMSAFCVVKRKNRKEDTLLLKFHLIFFFPRKKSLGEEEGCAENSNFCQKNKKKFMRTGTSHSDIIFFFENKIKSQRATWLCFSTCFSYKKILALASNLNTSFTYNPKEYVGGGGCCWESKCYNWNKSYIFPFGLITICIRHTNLNSRKFFTFSLFCHVTGFFCRVLFFGLNGLMAEWIMGYLLKVKASIQNISSFRFNIFPY